MIAAKTRNKRIRQLAKLVKGAAELYNSGALPQASYGATATGYTPTDINKLTAMAHEAAASDGFGQCATTNITIALGEQMIPTVRRRAEQIKAWLDLLLSPKFDLSSHDYGMILRLTWPPQVCRTGGRGCEVPLVPPLPPSGI